MTAFPSLIPSSRIFTPGEYPHAAYQAWSGKEGRVRHSNVMLNSTLRLTFTGLTEANMLSILSHYNGRQGGYLAFAIPSQMLNGVSAAADYTLPSYQWRYAAPPIVDDIPCAGHSVEVALESVPPEAIVLSGLESTVLLSLTPGTASATNNIGTLAFSLDAGVAFDLDAWSYIQAVESADSQELEHAIRVAVDKFVRGCKADGIWNAIKASCILAGARTLNGALAPLKGTAPTNFNFVAGDYNRKTGLAGDGSTKYLDSNRADNADPQNSKHLGLCVSTIGASSTNQNYMGAVGTGGSVYTMIQRRSSDTLGFGSRGSLAALPSVGSAATTGFYGVNRASSASYNYRAGVVGTVSDASITPLSINTYIFARNLQGTGLSVPTTARLSFYSIGESLDLALLNARVTQLMADIGAAI